MSEHSLSWFILIFTLLESVVKTHLTIYDSSHGFMPNSHDRYIIQDISSMHEELSGDIRSSSFNNMKLHLRFEPEFLDFKQRPLGVPHVEKVRLINTDRNRSIDMTSISGSTVHFHSSFFEDKKIPPLGNTTFNVVFLGREEGSIESSLYIHTTEGHLKYQVKGASVFSPYRLRPIVGVKLPINTSFSPLIYMHNPHTEPIQIVEVYSSGGDFHLELPSGELEGPKDLWEIPPLETKAVIRVRFYARTEQNHTAYVRIKLNNTEDILVVPLEVEVTSTAGLFCPQGSIDFGVGGSLDPPKHIKLYMQNPLKKVVKIHSVTSSSKAIKIEHENVKVPSDSKNSKNDGSSYEVATLTLDWKSAFEAREFSGKIIVKYKNGKGRTEIPYYITIVEGGLSFNSSVTKYFIKEKAESLSVRSVVVRNDFPTSVMLINVSLPVEAQSYFLISEFKSVILKPKEEIKIFSLKLRHGVSLSNLKLNSFITLRTNISQVEFPLYTYNGKLELHLPFKSKDNSLDLGLISVESKKDTYLLLLNRNPVSVTIKQMSTSLPVSTVDLIGCDKGDITKALLKDNYRNMTRCAKLRSNEYAILRLTVRTSRSEAQQWGEINVQTQYEQMSIPVHFKVAQGKLEIGPDRLVFDQCFPGKICSHPLRVHSTFNDPMVIEDILSIPPDSRISSKHTGHIMARATKIIGHLYLNPNIKCQNECYLGMQQDNTAQWLKTLTLTKLTSEFDLNLVNIFYNRYLNQTSNGQPRWQNLTMRMDTSEVKGHLFKTRVKMSWPSLLSDHQNVENKSTFVFPLTQVGNVTYHSLTIRNPSSFNLLVQLIFDHVYPGVEMLKEGLPPDFFPGPVDTKRNKPAFFFHTSHNNQKENFERLLNTDVNSNSLPFILKPGENYTVKIGYHAYEATLDSSFIFIRNNLTVLEIVHLKGQGAHPNFKFGNRKPGSLQPLQFELTEKHLKDCEREKNRKYPVPNLTVKRSFTARNTGDVTIYINSFRINGYLCEGYGFKVLNCEPFALAPNATKKIDIAFTPDFTLSKITRTLILDTSLNYAVNYTLVTTVPHYYLALCTSVLTRPTWESILYYLVICVMFFSLVFIVVAAILESERVIKLALNVITRQSSSVQPTLDLRLIGAQTKSEIQTPAPKNDTDEFKTKEKPLEKSGTKQEESKFNTNKVEEKYTALIPTTGKVKRKLNKSVKNCDNLSETIASDNGNSNKRLSSDKVQKKQVETKNYITETLPAENLKKNYAREKRSQNKKEVKQIETIQTNYEEETSSTTTESSNNEEIEKPLLKLTLRKSNSRNSNNNNSDASHQKNIEEAEVQQQHQHMKVERKRSGQHQKQNNKKEIKENIQDNKMDYQKEHKSSNKTSKTQKERREKQHPNNKNKTDKTSGKIHSESISSNNNNIRVSPSIQPTSIWSENRASFSDVVARSEPTNSAVSRSSQQSQPLTKPTMYVEPYKQNNTELGPIGSRKDNNYWGNNILQMNNNNNNGSDQFSQIQMPNNNNFFDQNIVGADNSNAFLDLNTMRESSIMTFLQPNMYQQNNVSPPPPAQDPWRSTTGTNNLWDNMFYTSLNEPAQSVSLISPDNCWSWGSPVWRPQLSDTTRTPTRTPPGFAPQRDLEERLQQNLHPTQQQTDRMYDPFGVNNIWNRQQSNPWNYPHSGQQ